MEEYNKLIEVINSTQKDFDKFNKKRQNAAGKRVVKKLRECKNIIDVLDNVITIEIKNRTKTKKIKKVQIVLEDVEKS